jgi:ribosomal protein S18 acetylase RimI-like enzyme
MKRMLYRMVLCKDARGGELPLCVQVQQYDAKRHHEAICHAYSRSFGEAAWPPDWDKFDEFDPKGAFVAEDAGTTEVVGYLLSFRRGDHGYISVVAVVPEYQRQGVGSALVWAAIGYLRGLGMKMVKIDAFVDATPAVSLYRKVGFQVESTFEDEEDE